MDNVIFAKNEYDKILTIIWLFTVCLTFWLVKNKDKKLVKLVVLSLKAIGYFALSVLAVSFDKEGMNMNPAYLTMGQIALSVISMIEFTDNFIEFLKLKNSKQEMIKELKNEKVVINKFLPVLLIFLPTLIFGIMGKTVEMSIMIIAGSIVCVFMQIEKFKMFKGGGFEAQLKEAVDKAYATVDMVNAATGYTVYSLVKLMTYEDRLANISEEEKTELISNLEKLTIDCDISQREYIGHAINEFKYLYGWDRYFNFINLFRQCSAEIYNKLHELSVKKDKFTKQDFSFKDWPTQKEISEILGDKISDLSTDQDSYLKDYLRYINLHKEENRGGGE